MVISLSFSDVAKGGGHECMQGRPKAPRRSKMRHRNPRGDKNKEVRGTKFKIVATRYHLLRLKCTTFDFGWGSLAGFKGSYF